MKVCTLATGTSFWYLEEYNPEAEFKTREDASLPEVYTIRNSGRVTLTEGVEATGPALYTIPFGHQQVLRTLRDETTMAEYEYLRYCSLWNLEELSADGIMNKVLSKREKLRTSQHTGGPENVNEASQNNERFWFTLLVEEGYRRYGGSARQVLRFVGYVAFELSEILLESHEHVKQAAVQLPDENHRLPPLSFPT